MVGQTIGLCRLSTSLNSREERQATESDGLSYPYSSHGNAVIRNFAAP